MSISQQQLYLASLPLNGKKADALFAALQNDVANSNNLKLYKFETPALTVGTLDSLMSMSDDLVKLNAQVEVCFIFLNHFCSFIIYLCLILEYCT